MGGLRSEVVSQIHHNHPATFLSILLLHITQALEYLLLLVVLEVPQSGRQRALQGGQGRDDLLCEVAQ